MPVDATSAALSTPGSDAVAAAPTGQGGTLETAGAATGSVEEAIGNMEAAFNRAIITNATITTRKTELGSIKTAAEQRPNIG